MSKTVFTVYIGCVCTKPLKLTLKGPLPITVVQKLCNSMAGHTMELWVDGKVGRKKIKSTYKLKDGDAIVGIPK